MQLNEELQRLGGRSESLGSRARGLLIKVLAVAASAILLLSAIAISIVVFAVVLAGLLVVGVYLWWKTRELRKQMRAQGHDAGIIEGEIVRDVRGEDEKR
jgi:hypothetical protein